MRARSPRKSGRYAQIAAACRTALERDSFRCRALGVLPDHVCRGPIDPQHVIPKGCRPDLAADPDNIIALCRGAHDWVGDHPDDAHDLGWHGYSWEEPPRPRPLAVPMRLGDPTKGG